MFDCLCDSPSHGWRQDSAEGSCDQNRGVTRDTTWSGKAELEPVFEEGEIKTFNVQEKCYTPQGSGIDIRNSEYTTFL
jgi:hypothetical protein